MRKRTLLPQDLDTIEAVNNTRTHIVSVFLSLGGNVLLIK